jgi:hypothetical protein
MNNYRINSADELSDSAIKIILQNWEIKEWLSMKPSAFRKKFRHSVFHLLTDTDGNILCFARINADFSLLIENNIYRFAEFVGFVSVEKRKGHGSALLQLIRKHAEDNKLQLIGFCDKSLRGFYTKNGLEILADKAGWIYEKEDTEWISSTDHDIIVLNLIESDKALLSRLCKEFPAYLMS